MESRRRPIRASTADGAVEIHDRATGEVVQTIDAHDDRVNGIAFSPDGTLLGTTSEDDTAELWDLATGELLHRFDRPRHGGLGDDSLVPSFSPDGTRFAFSWWTFAPELFGWSMSLRVRWCKRSSTLTGAIR